MCFRAIRVKRDRSVELTLGGGPVPVIDKVNLPHQRVRQRQLRIEGKSMPQSVDSLRVNISWIFAVAVTPLMIGDRLPRPGGREGRIENGSFLEKRERLICKWSDPLPHILALQIQIVRLDIRTAPGRVFRRLGSIFPGNGARIRD